MKTCCNCGATEEEAGPIDLVFDLCVECVEKHEDACIACGAEPGSNIDCSRCMNATA